MATGIQTREQMTHGCIYKDESMYLLIFTLKNLTQM